MSKAFDEITIYYPKGSIELQFPGGHKIQYTLADAITPHSTFLDTFYKNYEKTENGSYLIKDVILSLNERKVGVIIDGKPKVVK